MSARFLFILVLFTVALAPLAPAGADPVANLHAADVRVHDQSPQARTAALKDALAQVLVKVTGSRAVLETETAATLLENAARYVQQYRYENLQPAPEDPEAAPLLLRAEFDGSVIEQRLRAAGLPLWGRERPLTLVWAAYSDTTERRLVGRDPADPLVDALRRTASRRGLPLVLPLLDTEDATRVSFMDVWGIYEDPLLAAAARYSPDAVLVGSVFRAGGDLWAGRWTLLRDGQRQERWELSGASPEAVTVGVVDALADHYGREFAVHTAMSGGSTAVVEVMDVEQLHEYAKVQSYLAGLSVVKNAGLQRIDDGSLRFELELNGTVRALEQSIALGRVLEPLPAEEITVRLEPAPSDLVDAKEQASGRTGDTGNATPLPTPQPPVLRYRLRQ